MANVFTELAPILFSAAQEVSQEPIGALDSISMNFDDKGVAIWNTVKVPVAPAASTANYTPAMTTTAGTDKTADAVSVTISDNKQTSWNLTGEQQLSLQNATSDKEWVRQLIAQGMRAIRNEAESTLCTTIYQGASRAVGTAGTPPFASDIDVIAELRKVLRDNGAPMSDMNLILNTTAALNAFKLSILQQADQAGTAEERRQGVFLRQFGFMIKESAGIASHTKGTMTGADCTAVEPVGETTVACDGSDSGTVLAGDVVTRGNEGGSSADTNKYVVNSGSTLTGNASGNFILNRPGLKLATTATDEWTIGDSYTANVGFERSSIVGIMRPPIIPVKQSIQQFKITDGKGLTYLLVQIIGDGMITWRLHLAYGFKVVQPEHVAILMG